MGHGRFALGTNFGKYFDCAASPSCYQRRVSRSLSADSKPILWTQPSVQAAGAAVVAFVIFLGNEAAAC